MYLLGIFVHLDPKKKQLFTGGINIMFGGQATHKPQHKLKVR